MNELPLINQRIKNIIDSEYNGNVSKFSQAIGLSDSSKINRLFNIDKRNNKYPYPSIEIIEIISNELGYTTDFLIKGIIDNNKKVNNININNSKNIDGSNNNIDSTISENIEDYKQIIKKQQEQIDSLLEILKNK